jgi:CO dehydrogenase nickel-insertion accessory protein CooC1
MTTTKISKCIIYGIIVCFAILAPLFSYSQSKVDSLLGKIDPQKLAASVQKKMDKLQDKLVEKSLTTLNRLERQEEKIYKKLLKGKDSTEAKLKLEETKSKYAALRNTLKTDSLIGNSTIYLAKLDTLSGVMKFLNVNGRGGNVKDALAATKLLQYKMQQGEEIQKFIQQRKEQLKNQLEQLGLVRQLKQFNKQVYYYSEQLKEYKSLLKDSKKMERKAIELLSKTNLFKEFMRKNSQLASLFRIPDPNQPSNAANLAGLQTRAQITNMLQQQIGSSGLQQFRQQMQDAKSQIDRLKNEMLKAGKSSSDDIMPKGFRPNSQRVKKFWKRIELGTNIQTVKNNGLLPVTTDLGLSAGYRLDDRSIIGIGGSYKIGFGKSIQNINITHQGVSLRSFIDWKLKKNLWVTGGYEMNYRAAFNSISLLKDLNAWQRSGLLGLSKKMNMKTKFFKNTKLQLLWDFISYQQMPRTPAIVFRIEYNLK